MPNRKTLLKILDLARWAPSGDNTQPWRFEIISDCEVIVRGFDTRDHVLYDMDGHASHLAHGALLETLRIAASSEGLTAKWEISAADRGNRHVNYAVRLSPAPETPCDPLFPFIKDRVVQRRPMRLTPLSDVQRSALYTAAGDTCTLQLFESIPDRLAIAKLLWDNAYIRLTCPEAFQVHQQIIEWGAQFSNDRLPEQAIGIDPVTAKLMKWVMQSWDRVAFFNRYLMGTLLPRIELDFLPALMCAGHMLIRPKARPKHLEDWIEIGRIMQRVWLTATQLGLLLQPEMTPVIFRWYANAGRSFSDKQILASRAHALARRFNSIAGASDADEFGFFCRIGTSPPPRSRSLRKGLPELLA